MRKAVRIVSVVVTAIAIGVPAVYAADTMGQTGATPVGWVAANRINVNTATVDQLAKVPLLDMATAKSIVEYRDKNGPFDSVDQLQFVKGIYSEDLGVLESYLLAD